MRLATMALRNLGRNRRRTLLAASSVAISILLVVMLQGLIEGFLGSIVRNYTKNDTGHVNIVTEGYRERERFSPVSEYIRGSAGVAELLSGLRGLRGPGGAPVLVAERIRFGVVLSSGAKSKAAMGVAGDPAAERKLLMLDRSLLPGSGYVEAPGDAILGEALARDLGLGVGDVLKVVTQRSDFGLGFKRFRVAGIFRTRVNTLDESVFQVGLEDARELLAMGGAAGGAEGGGSQQILVMLADYRDADRAAAAIRSALASAGIGGLSVMPWTALGDFPRFIRMAESVYVWMYVLVAFLGAFIIANVMMMVVLERRREIGILKSMGMPRRDVLGLFILEGSLIGAGGSAVGAALGTALNALLGITGLDMTAAMASFQWPMDNVIHPTTSAAAALAFFALGTLVSAVMSILPSRNAAGMDPIEAIRSV